MRKSKLSPAQIIRILRETERGKTIPEMMTKRINLDTRSYVKGGKLTCSGVLTRQVWQVECNDG